MAIAGKAYTAQLSRYGLNRSTLRALGDRVVNLEVYIDHPPLVNPTGKQLARLIALRPAERAARVCAWRERQFEQLRRELPAPDAKVIRFNRARIGLKVALPARAVARVCRLRHAGRLEIVSIVGRRKVRLVTKPRLYVVRARMIEVVEGQTRGFQTVEDRVIALMARSNEEAKRRVTKQLGREEYVALTTSGRFVGWLFECIVDSEELLDRSFSPVGTEVYYSFKNDVSPENAGSLT